MTVKKDIWVFAYGSLMWRPGFDYLESRKVTLDGYHRDLCILSHVFRGTPQVPGLVLGLNPGGTCLGVAFRVAGAQVADVMDYLYEREMVHDVYEPKWLKARDETGEVMETYTFVSIADHPQYVGHFEQDTKVDLVLQGVGQMGRSLEYLENTCRHIRALGIVDEGLERILHAAQAKEMQKTTKKVMKP